KAHQRAPAIGAGRSSRAFCCSATERAQRLPGTLYKEAMMKRGRIAVSVEKGMFESERSVSFDGIGQTFHLVVDERDVRDGMLEVGILDESRDSYVVALPKDTFTSGSTVRVARATVEVV